MLYRSGTQATTFDTARFRPPQSLTLSALKLYFAQHPQDRQRRVLDTKLDEVPRVNQAVADVGLTSANGQLSFGQVRVTQEEGARLLQQLLNELVRLSGRYIAPCADFTSITRVSLAVSL